MKLFTIRTFKKEVLMQTVYQRGPGDTSGHERDVEWRKEVRKAKTWDDLTSAVYCVGGRWTGIAANDGRLP